MSKSLGVCLHHAAQIRISKRRLQGQLQRDFSTSFFKLNNEQEMQLSLSKAAIC